MVKKKAAHNHTHIPTGIGVAIILAALAIGTFIAVSQMNKTQNLDSEASTTCTSTCNPPNVRLGYCNQDSHKTKTSKYLCHIGPMPKCVPTKTHSCPGL